MTTKRKREPIRAPTEEEWNLQKQAIGDLYFESTLTKLMEYMENERNFIAFKNQYERKQEWGFRRNLTPEEWKYVFRKQHKREDAHKDNQFMLHDLAIPKEKIKKQESRYTYSELDEILSSYSNAPSPKAPGGIWVLTPPPSITEQLFRQIRIDNLPFFRLRDFFTSQGRLIHNFLNRSQPPEYGLFPLDASTPRIFDMEEPEEVPLGSVLPQLHSSTPRLFDLEDDPEISLYEHTIGRFAATTLRLSSLVPPPDRLILDFFPEKWETDRTVLRDQREVKNSILRRLGNSILERHEGDIEERIERLLGTSDADAFQSSSALLCTLFPTTRSKV